MRSSIRTRTTTCLLMALMAAVLVGADDPRASLDRGAATSQSQSALPSAALPDAHTPPVGSTAPVDDATWALVDRLTAPAYTSDTTAALVDGLARSGIGTYADPSSTAPETPITALESPSRLLDFQAHGLAVGVWAHSTFTGAELDTVMPLPPDVVGMPTTSELLAAYVATADSPGGALSRGLMAGQDLLTPTTARFPGVVLTLFASDIATDGGRLAAPPAAVRVTYALANGICSAASAWIEGTISSLFEAIKLATPANLPGAIIVHIWNWLVDTAHAFVDSLISAASDAVLGTIRSIAGSVAAVAQQVSSFLPYAVRVVASGDPGGATFRLGPAPLAGTFTATVTAGDLPTWPSVLADCASVARVALPDFRPVGIPLTWGPLEPAVPLLAGTADASTKSATDGDGRASWPFLTSTDPGKEPGAQQNQVDDIRVTVIRPEIDQARERLTAALMGGIPSLLQPFVAALFAPYVDGLQSRLNMILVARGDGVAVLIYHSPPPPTPAPVATPRPSPACADPLPVGSYRGTNTSSETIKNRPSVTHEHIKGPVQLVVAPDGSVTGSWSYTSHFVYDATVSDVHHHHESTTAMDGGTLSGTSCGVILGGGTTRTTSCTDSLKGDCMGTSTGQSPARGPQALGQPTSVSGSTFTWSGKYANPDSGITVTYSVSVTGT